MPMQFQERGAARLYLCCAQWLVICIGFQARQETRQVEPQAVRRLAAPHQLDRCTSLAFMASRGWRKWIVVSWLKCGISHECEPPGSAAALQKGLEVLALAKPSDARAKIPDKIFGAGACQERL